MNRVAAALRLVGVGWYIGVCIFLGVFGGQKLDNKFHTEPWLMIGGLLLGVFLAFYGVYRMILPNIGKKQNENKGKS